MAKKIYDAPVTVKHGNATAVTLGGSSFSSEGLTKLSEE